MFKSKHVAGLHADKVVFNNNNNLFSCNWAVARWQWSYTCTHLLKGELGILKPGGLHEKHEKSVTLHLSFSPYTRIIKKQG